MKERAEQAAQTLGQSFTALAGMALAERTEHSDMDFRRLLEIRPNPPAPRAAIEASKSYIPAYERLAALYADQGAAAGAKRRAIARQALTQPNLDANQKKMLHKLAE